jgi:DNA-binding response OmpR family regulator
LKEPGVQYQPSVLLIETEPSLRHTLAMILQQAGYAVTTAGHTQDAPRHADAQAYDLIFLDIDRVGLGSTDLLQTIYRLRPDIPMLILAASSVGGIVNAASPNERRAYLVKPIDPAKLLACIRDLLDRSRPPAS